MSANSTERFSDRADNYVKYRPSYPAEIIDILTQKTSLLATSSVADIGSGTGISAKLFLDNNCTVFGVEPNQAMRIAAEKWLQPYPAFHGIAGTAEATTLPDCSVDYAIAAQAFHWFDPVATKRELARILKPSGWFVLIWNVRRLSSTPFLQAYESFLQKYGTDYTAVGHRVVDRSKLQSFYGQEPTLKKLYNEQTLDLPSLAGRLLSSSYVPNAEHPNFRSMLNELEALFEQYNENGIVRLEYDTELYWEHIVYS